MVELAFEELDELGRRHRVQLDAPGPQELNLPFEGAVIDQRIDPGLEVLDRRRLGRETLDVLQPQAEVDDRDIVLELVAAAILAQRSEDREARDVEVTREELTYIKQEVDASLKIFAKKIERSVMRKNLWVLSSLAFSSLITPLEAIAQAQQQPPGPDYWPAPWHMMWGWGMFPMMLLFLILFCVVVFFFARGCMGGMHRWGPSHPWSDPTHSGLQILNERFAKGEIQKEEYNEKKAAILSGPQR